MVVNNIQNVNAYLISCGGFEERLEVKVSVSKRVQEKKGQR